MGEGVDLQEDKDNILWGSVRLKVVVCWCVSGGVRLDY